MRLLELGAGGPDVAELQRQLRQLGFDIPSAAEGLFEARTLDAVRALQSASFILNDGRVWTQTRAVIAAELTAQGLPELRTFRGRWGFLLREESHKGRPYWPGGDSGVTLDPGFDLGQESGDRLQFLYARVLSREDLEALRPALGVRGAFAGDLARSARLQAIAIPREAAAATLPRIAGRYWQDAARALPAALRPSVRGEVHTALLSLCYNKGADALTPLRQAVKLGDWQRAADLVAGFDRGEPEHLRRLRESVLLRPPQTKAPETI